MSVNHLSVEEAEAMCEQLQTIYSRLFDAGLISLANTALGLEEAVYEEVIADTEDA